MTLAKDDKIQIISQHIKNLEYNAYNLEMSLLEENSATQKDESTISSLNEQMDNIDAKVIALQSELTKVQAM